MNASLSASFSVMYCAAKSAQLNIPRLGAEYLSSEREIRGYFIWLMRIIEREAGIALNQFKDESFDWRILLHARRYLRIESRGSSSLTRMEKLKVILNKLVEKLEEHRSEELKMISWGLKKQ